MGCARLLSYAHWIQAGLGLFALPEIPWTSVRCAVPCMVLHGRGLPALRRTPSLTRMGLLLSLQLAFSQVKPLECPGAGATLKNKGKTISTAVPCPVKVPQAGCLAPLSWMLDQPVWPKRMECLCCVSRSTPFPSSTRELSAIPIHRRPPVSEPTWAWVLDSLGGTKGEGPPAHVSAQPGSHEDLLCSG